MSRLPVGEFPIGDVVLSRKFALEKLRERRARGGQNVTVVRDVTEHVEMEVATYRRVWADDAVSADDRAVIDGDELALECVDRHKRAKSEAGILALGNQFCPYLRFGN